MNISVTHLSTPSVDAIVPDRAIVPTGATTARRPGRLRSGLARLVAPFRTFGRHSARIDPGGGPAVRPQDHRVDLQTRFHVH